MEDRTPVLGITFTLGPRSTRKVAQAAGNYFHMEMAHLFFCLGILHRGKVCFSRLLAYGQGAYWPTARALTGLRLGRLLAYGPGAYWPTGRALDFKNVPRCNLFFFLFIEKNKEFFLKKELVGLTKYSVVTLNLFKWTDQANFMWEANQFKVMMV